MCVNKIKSRIKFKTKHLFYLKFVMPETMKLLGSTKNKINKDKNFYLIVPHLEITEVILGHFNIVHNEYQHNSRVQYTFIPNK